MTPEVRLVHWKYCGKEEKLLLGSKFSSFPLYFCYLFLDFHVKTGTRFSLRDQRLFEISEAEIRRVDCTRDVRGREGGLNHFPCTKPPNYKYMFGPHSDPLNPGSTQRPNYVASTSLRRHDVLATSKQRNYDVMCLLGTSPKKLHSENTSKTL